MRNLVSATAFALLSLMSLEGAARPADSADLIIYNARIWTVDARKPTVEALAIRGDRIMSTGSKHDMLALKDEHTKLLDLQGQFVMPSFNDGHTHFENAVDWLFQVRLIDLDGEAGKQEMMRRLADVRARVPAGIWITGGDWGDLAAGAASKAGRKDFQTFQPDLAAVDAITPDNPVLLRRFDRAYFANSKALKLAHISRESPDPRGGSYGRDSRGELTGMLYGKAGEAVEKLMPPVTLEQKVIGARAVQQDLNRLGITSIADIARLDELSQQQLYPTYVERSYSNLAIFQRLKARQQLSLRVYAFLPLDYWDRLGKYGIRPHGGDDMIRFGALKAFGDAGIMYQPLHIDLGLQNDWAWRMMGEKLLKQRIVDSCKGGFDVGVHIIGDKALHSLLDWFEAAEADPACARRAPRERLIHAWYATADDLKRAGRLHLIADVTPDHLMQNVSRLEAALGPERARTAFAWRTMIDHGVRVDLVSDLPGTYNRAILSTVNPLHNMYMAVTRKPIDGSAGPAFHPEQAMTIEEAIQAYTINPAYASHEEAIKGSITPGKLADLVVLSNDIVTADPERLLTTEVVYTFLGGKVVYQSSSDETSKRADTPSPAH
ncbi:amidohydrolase [Massilia terrae]|uniref:Amidohydrolase n=1 Tax=Massilia terrae TaxID=1811224 RepID=A0ABT2D0U0_9BURK|nr:amidohydrolase [Massilia terrae]MCS0658973.1 amidohydrolase [Massilia terrae]